MATHANRVQMSVTGTPGTGTITLNAASSGYRSFATAYGANATVDVFIVEGTAWEVAKACTYTHSGTTLSRGTLENSSTGSAVAFTSAALVSVVETAAWGNDAESLMGVFGRETVSITGTTTLTATAFGKMHICTGTTSNYTITLPAISGNSKKWIGFLMGGPSALTKKVTLDGNASETINGQTTRIMWSGETAVIQPDATEWKKLHGTTKAMQAVGAPSGNTTVPTGGETRINLNTAFSDPTGFICDTANNEMVIPRDGTYRIVPCGRISNATGNLARWYSGVHRDRGGTVTQWIVLTELYAAATSYTVASIGIPFTCLEGDKMRLYVGGTNGGNETAAGSGNTSNSFLAIEEMPLW